MIEDSEIVDEIENNKNKHSVRCQYCFSLILKKLHAEYTKFEKGFELPLMHQKHSKDVKEVATEPQTHFWVVGDMFVFENIGFSNTVDHYKYLTCADCDMGPVGYHNITDKKSYIALRRVKHGDDPDAVLEAPAPEDADFDENEQQNGDEDDDEAD